MQSFTHAGCAYRPTKAMTEEAANRFAACLQANKAFTEVQVCPAPRSHGKFIVTYVPVNEERRRAMLVRENDARLLRAYLEGGSYLFVADESARFFWCQSASGEVYEVTSRSCTCPDHTYRGSRFGIPCKHILALTEGISEPRSF
jgi:predicted nucleic acid-binding Zn finger protein